jgi:hypothetical protein
MKTNFSANNINNAMGGDLPDERAGRFGFRLLISAALTVLAAISFTGCAGGYYAAGYGPAYYSPDYGPYYADYVYDGSPYWGTGAYYGGEIVVGGEHHRGYYGGHHFAHEWGGGHARGGGPSHAAARGGGGGRRR